MDIPDPAPKSFMVDLLTGGMPDDLIGEKAVVDYIEEYANTVATQMKDFKHSAKVREVLQNPESKKEQYDKLMKAAKCHILAAMLQMASVQALAVANGTMNKALNNVPFKPMIAFPDNAFGKWMLDTTLAFLEHIGHDGGPMQKTEIADDKPKRKSNIIIEE